MRSHGAAIKIDESGSHRYKTYRSNCEIDTIYVRPCIHYRASPLRRSWRCGGRDSPWVSWQASSTGEPLTEQRAPRRGNMVTTPWWFSSAQCSPRSPGPRRTVVELYDENKKKGKADHTVLFLFFKIWSINEYILHNSRAQTTTAMTFTHRFPGCKKLGHFRLGSGPPADGQQKCSH